MDIRRIDDSISVTPQIRPDDLPAIAAAGFTTIVNNRPDGEEPGQPTGEAIRLAAEEAGIGYHAIPVTQAGIGHGEIDAMGSAVAGAPGPVLAFCRSGTRSCNLWAMTAAKAGGDPAELVGKGQAAGYSLGGIRPTLDMLAAR